MKVKQVFVKVSDVQKLETGSIVVALDGSKLVMVDGVVTLCKGINKPTFERFHLPHDITAKDFTPTTSEMKELIKASQEDKGYICHASSGYVGEDGKVLPLDEQIKQGVARNIFIKIAINNPTDNPTSFDSYHIVEAYEQPCNAVTIDTSAVVELHKVDVLD